MLEDICVSLETANSLVEAGVVIESIYIWGNDCVTNEIRLFRSDSTRLVDKQQPVYPAPTAEEIKLPTHYPSKLDDFNYECHIGILNNGYTVCYTDGLSYPTPTFANSKLCEALAQMLLWLKKEGYLDV
jgi:hypothetical protein